eukprot:CAMPEP_0184482374 /NCGR_PEP_ID=MMETSP0113_2-20130426/3931_1 /TAXON_ID=91329 /ORGANISM="Norrisiella sphaerica, Strain BC52" /LENGTH=457 /DNA_ID=CAMNT_0026862069 /DNA_START=160 /DNA_END=1533 /DNA_ORIENTATION=-
MNSTLRWFRKCLPNNGFRMITKPRKPIIYRSKALAAAVVGSGSVCLAHFFLFNHAEAVEAVPVARGHVYVVGDIGGTKSRIRMFKSDTEMDQETLLASKTYPSQEYGCLTTILQEFLEDNQEIIKDGGRPRTCVLAVAGPVDLNRVYMPNTNWNLDGEEMGQKLDIPKVVLMNDFVGVGYGILGMKKGDCHVIQDKPCNPRGPIVVFGPGTGLGQAYLTYDRKEYTVWPSEGGHSDWAPRTNEEMRLWHFLKTRIRRTMRAEGKKVEVDHVSQERVISGSGIADLYDFFRGEHPEFVDPNIEQKMNQMDKSAVVSIHGGRNDNFLCRMAMEQWARSFGQSVGDLALTYMPTGGIYIAGGVAPKNLQILKETEFTKWVNAKGRLSKTMESIPVFVVKEETPVGVIGARVVARRVLRDMYPLDNIHAESQPSNRQESELFLEKQYPEILSLHDDFGGHP